MEMKIKQIQTFAVFHRHIIQTTAPENILLILKQRQCLLGVASRTNRKKTYFTHGLD